MNICMHVCMYVCKKQVHYENAATQNCATQRCMLHRHGRRLLMQRINILKIRKHERKQMSVCIFVCVCAACVT